MVREIDIETGKTRYQKVGPIWGLQKYKCNVPTPHCRALGKFFWLGLPLSRVFLGKRASQGQGLTGKGYMHRSFFFPRGLSWNG